MEIENLTCDKPDLGPSDKFSNSNMNTHKFEENLCKSIVVCYVLSSPNNWPFDYYFHTKVLNLVVE